MRQNPDILNDKYQWIGCDEGFRHMLFVLEFRLERKTQKI